MEETFLLWRHIKPVLWRVGSRTHPSSVPYHPIYSPATPCLSAVFMKPIVGECETQIPGGVRTPRFINTLRLLCSCCQHCTVRRPSRIQRTECLCCCPLLMTPPVMSVMMWILQHLLRLKSSSLLFVNAQFCSVRFFVVRRFFLSTKYFFHLQTGF